jgi:peptidoglycan hydrolase CwlO-like protein
MKRLAIATVIAAAIAFGTAGGIVAAADVGTATPTPTRSVSADKVSRQLSSLRDDVDDISTRLDDLETTSDDHEQRISDVEDQITDLDGRLTDVEDSL